MYDYFLTAFCPDDQIDRARAVIMGVCGTPGRHEYDRVLFYRGPDVPDGFKNLKAVEKSVQNRAAILELQRYLARETYIVRLEYPTMYAFGPHAAPQILDQMKGTLHWTEQAEPVIGDVLHIHRRSVIIPEQDKLISLMQQNGYSFKNDCVQESYIHVLDDFVEFRLFRFHHFPQDSTPSGPDRTHLPELSKLRPDSTWILRLYVLVEEDKPELFNRAVELLTQARQQLGTAFDFLQIDRRVFDTRVHLSASRNAVPKPLGPVVPVSRRS